MRLILALPLLAALLTTPSARAAESFESCIGFIETLPAVITTQGVWCMDHDLATAATTGKAIDIQVNNVTIDCNGFKLGNLSAGIATQAIGIYGQGRTNIKVRGCSTRGFRYGIALEAGAGQIIEDNRIEAATAYGIFATGDLVLIRRNFVQDIGSAGVSSVAGITAIRANIIDNTVADIASDDFGVGIYLFGSIGSVVTGNRISGPSAFEAYGIYVEAGHVQLHGNFLIGLNDGVGIRCGSAAGWATDNLISDYDTATTICTVDGNRFNP